MKEKLQKLGESKGIILRDREDTAILQHNSSSILLGWLKFRSVAVRRAANLFQAIND